MRVMPFLLKNADTVWHRSSAPILLLLLLLPAQHAYAQTINAKEYDYRPMISDLNAAAHYLTKRQLSNGDVVMVSAITCATMRVAIRERYAQRIGSSLKEIYPSADTVERASLADFIAAEREILGKLGAKDPALDLVSRTIQDHPTLPTTPPAASGELIDRISTVEKSSCEYRSEHGTVLSQEATPEKVSMAKCFGKAVVGLSVMVVDYAAGVAVSGYVGPFGLYIIGAISASWGWNRVEEGCLQ